MRLGLISIVLCLTAITGCAASQARDTSPDLSDPSWTPPGEMDIAIGADPEVKAKPKPRARTLQQPNHREMGTGLRAASRDSVR
jgi:hypothetical protein